jgi:electron transfer flavoprotein alpha subunit
MLLLLAEHDGNHLHDSTAKALTGALQIDPDVQVLVAGESCARIAEEASRLVGVVKVVLAQDPVLRDSLAEPCAALLCHLAAPFSTIAAPATTSGRNILPRLAALLDVMQISDIIAVKNATTFERPIYAGNAIETVQALQAKNIVTFRPAAFAPAPFSSDSAAPVETIAIPSLPSPARHIGSEKVVLERPELSAARVVVSGGRAFGSAEAFLEQLGPLADRLGAALGASRAAVDAGYAPNDWQVGQTGKIVAPDLYIAAGISGAIQHLAGMKGAKVIVAINKDTEAPIFQVADYGLVGDIFTLLPELVQELDKQK